MDPWTLLADPYDRAPLRREGELLRDGELRGGLLRNDAGVWPILGGVPVVVPDPARWLGARREPVLAALAEAGRADRETVDRLDAFASQVRGVGRIEIPDDFLDQEEPPYEVLGPPALRDLLAGPTLAERIAADLGPGPVLELGCGAGALTRRIGARPLVVVDHSPRAILRATAGLDPRDTLGVVGEALALPVAPGVFGTVVAANLVDLVDDPAALVDEMALALRPGGRLVCTTPDPALGVRGTDEALVDLLEGAGLRIVDDEDGIVWPRVHSPRQVQIYVVRRLVAERIG